MIRAARALYGVVVPVAGVTFAPGYPGNLLDLVERLAAGEGLAAELHRDLDNADDLNAVAVRVEGRHLGHLPRDVAGAVAPILDAGHQLAAEIHRIRVDLDHRHRPGLDVVLLPPAR